LSAHAELAPATAETRIQDDLGADLQSVHVRAQCGHDTCSIGSDDLGIGVWIGCVMRSTVKVEVIQGGCPDFEESLAGARDGIGKSLDRHHGP
jgi:hypothetical protein